MGLGNKHDKTGLQIHVLCVAESLSKFKWNPPKIFQTSSKIFYVPTKSSKNHPKPSDFFQKSSKTAQIHERSSKNLPKSSNILQNHPKISQVSSQKPPHFILPLDPPWNLWLPPKLRLGAAPAGTAVQLQGSEGAGASKSRAKSREFDHETPSKLQDFDELLWIILNYNKQKKNMTRLKPGTYQMTQRKVDWKTGSFRQG